MGMISEFLFANKPDAKIDIAKLPETVKEYLCHNLSFESNVFSTSKRARSGSASFSSHSGDSAAASDSSAKPIELIAGSAKVTTAAVVNADAPSSSSNKHPVHNMLSIHSFGEHCDGKLYGYLTGCIKQHWMNIAKAATEPVTLYFYYEEGQTFRIALNPAAAQQDDPEGCVWEINHDSKSWKNKKGKQSQAKTKKEHTHSRKRGRNEVGDAALGSDINARHDESTSASSGATFEQPQPELRSHHKVDVEAFFASVTQADQITWQPITIRDDECCVQ